MLGVHFNHRETWSTKTQTSKMARNGPLNTPPRAWQKIEQMSGMLPPPRLFYNFPISKFSIIICIVLRVPWNLQKRIVFREPTEVSFVMRHNGIWLLFRFCVFSAGFFICAYCIPWKLGRWFMGPDCSWAEWSTQSGQIWHLDPCPQPFLGRTGKNGSCCWVLPAPDFTIVHYLVGAGGGQAPVYWFLGSIASSNSSLQPPIVKTCQKSSYSLPRTKWAPLRRSRYQYFIIIILS